MRNLPDAQARGQLSPGRKLNEGFIPDELILIVFDGDRKEFNVGYWHCDLGSIVPEAA
jgi:hypothetical protein